MWQVGIRQGYQRKEIHRGITLRWGVGASCPPPFFCSTHQELSGDTSKGKVLFLLRIVLFFTHSSFFFFHFFLYFFLHRESRTFLEIIKTESAERSSSQKERVRRRKDLYRKGHEQERTHLSFRTFPSLPRGTFLFLNLPQAWNWLVWTAGSEPFTKFQPQWSPRASCGFCTKSHTRVLSSP